ncbi:hypothetical protein MUK42_11710 [Musa troglodytarum]|uniref:Uncharacterized protein n=1 Tax=Musa troglodytarum TaxID=320322 RepID=A0A9E7KH62_9LILI|nr:hypothetical protein MUK42_11710 [Musa troglodytarum]
MRHNEDPRCIIRRPVVIDRGWYDLKPRGDGTSCRAVLSFRLSPLVPLMPILLGRWTAGFVVDTEEPLPRLTSNQYAVDEDKRNMHLKSSLKKPFADGSVLGIQAVDSNDSFRELPTGFTKRSKVQWTDTNGNELVKIKEYEPSDDDSSDDEFGYHGGRCECIIQ